MISITLILPDGSAVTVIENPFPGVTALYCSLSKRTTIILVGPRFFFVKTAPPESPHILIHGEKNHLITIPTTTKKS